MNSSIVYCPCQSKKRYADCCLPLHLGQETAVNAEALMRSRYTAYVLQKIDYIVQTTVPAQQDLLDLSEMLTWSKETHWDGLEVIKQQAKTTKRHAQVEFKAFYQTTQGRAYHHELSTFVYIDDRWYFLDPTVDLAITMKQSCLCGSGQKFKHCCAVYL